MIVEERAREAATAVTARVDEITLPTADLIARRARRPRRVAIAAAAVAAVVAIAIAAITSTGRHKEPSIAAGRPRTHAWSLMYKEAAGIGRGSSLGAIASNGQVTLLAGAVQQGNDWRTALWRSTDGRHWTRAEGIDQPGGVDAVAIHGRAALAVGDNLAANTVWRSTDGGRTWHAAPRVAARFGAPAPSMGRPFVSQVVSYRGLWIAAGGASDGYAAVWTSRDGEHWRQTLASHGSGSAALVSGPHHALLAYVHNDIWSTTDGSAWGAPTHWQLPGHMYLGSVADGGRIALGFDDRHENAPTPLLRATLGDRFVETQVSPANTAKTSAWTVQRVRGLWVVEGWKGQPNQRPAAWVSRDLTHWESLPARLAGTPGGVLSLVASVGDRIVLLGTAPELDRFYTLTP